MEVGWSALWFDCEAALALRHGLHYEFVFLFLRLMPF